MSAERTFAPTQLPVVATERTAAVREQARVAGYAAGWSAGTRAAAEAAAAASRRVADRADAAADDARARLADALRTLGAASGAAAAREAGVVTDAAATIVTLALELAEAVVGVELANGERSARAALTRALAVPCDAVPTVVRLNPADHARLRALCDAGTLVTPPGVELVDDPTLGAGDAVSELPTGHLDARVSTAVARMRAELEALVDDGDDLGTLLAEIDAALPSRGGAR